ncbi:MAG: PKD domain-containing protein [Dehalococcoidia bacterium]|nr:PKD domain-containing protein [Dehalococcoidia bacterium]
MKISRGSLVAVVAVLAVAAILGSACAAPAPPPVTPPAPVPNQSPVISKVTANPAEVVSGKSITITAVAADPDDDPLTYSWSASDGTITGTGSEVTWAAPNKTGNINIGLTVTDNRGGQATGSVAVNVVGPSKTITINTVPSETGTVDQKNATDYARVRAGDDANNVGYRAFWSFDIYSLAGKDIQSATLKFSEPTVSGSPFAYNAPPLGLGGLWLWKTTHGSSLPTFGYVGSKLIHVGLIYDPPTTVDVTVPIQQLATAGVSRFQIEGLFNKVSNGNVTLDMAEWPPIVLEVTYAVK